MTCFMVVSPVMGRMARPVFGFPALTPDTAITAYVDFGND
jgi:hypothetical protein